MVDKKETGIHNFLSSASSVYRMRGGYKFVLLWSIFASIWVITIGTLFILFIYAPKELDNVFITGATLATLFLGIPVLVFAFITIVMAYRGYKQFKIFTSDFYPLWLRTRMELTPSPNEVDLKVAIKEKINLLLPSFKKFSKIDGKLSSKLVWFDVVLKSGNSLALVKITQSDVGIDVDNLISSMKKLTRGVKIKLLAIVFEGVSTFKEEDLVNLKLGLRKETGVIVIDYSNYEFTIKDIIAPKVL